MKYRILEEDGKFQPQKRVLGFWVDALCYGCMTLKGARLQIDLLIERKVKEKQPRTITIHPYP